MQQKRRTPSLFGKLCSSLVEAVAFRKGAVRFGEQAVASEPLSALQRPLLSASVCTTSLPGKVEPFFTISRDEARKQNVLAAWEALLKRGAKPWHL